MALVDANIVLRYLLNDHAELSAKAKSIIDDSVVEIPVEVLCEVVYVLSGIYTVSRRDICNELGPFLKDTACEIKHQRAILYALDLYAESKLDFVDCILAGLHQTEHLLIHTFDKQLLKQLKAQSQQKTI